MSKEIVLEWLQDTANTLFKKDIKAHLNLISKDVSLTGIPGYENIDYNSWSAQCTHEFADDLITNVNYVGLIILSSDDSRIMFKTLEIVEATNGSKIPRGIEAVIQKETDGVWRLIKERVLTDDEARQDGLLR